MDEILTAVNHLAKHGYVRVLRSWSGECAVLLTPELLNNIAASILLKARRNPRGLEALPEGHLLRGVFEFQDTRDLTEEDRRVLIDAAVMLFLQNNICFRESFGMKHFSFSQR